MLSYALLGLPLAVIRVISAFISALIGGALIDTYASPKDEKLQAEISSESSKAASSCCKSTSPCASDSEKEEKTHRLSSWSVRSIFAFLSDMLRFGFSDLLSDLTVLLALGFVLGGLVSVSIPPELFIDSPIGPFWQIIAMCLASLPFYICATSSTPLAAAFFAKGIAPGAVLVFLLAGPASNTSTMLVVKDEIGIKGLLLYLAAVFFVTLFFALLVQFFADTIVPPQAAFSAHRHEGVFSFLLALFFCGLMIKHLWQKVSRH